ncbi:hypothetical protein FO519_007532 [Halicephalobus sp. NKZ332]|nr:hypothetical protein FO519_007532 [Halicephalobus sp. NKZ332]
MQSDSVKMFIGKVLVFCVLLVALSEAITLNKPFRGHFTYYNGPAKGACGEYLDASRDMAVAVSREWFTRQNPNNDPICNYCVRVDYKGKSIKLPINNMCGGCPKNHMDLTFPAFKALEDPVVGDAHGATFTFVNC